ncbi:MAG: ABC transporter ATP-binding protein [Rhizobiales bacterium]|nr:ABC transporter ATP-binding protein [Hyphomicrobiales bacterium]MBO6699938.1 ABC transporter ATP-binding protein [Hyphomicrobiales bacterium]MBO6737896.1 ABC transporter ATP-binding protein [Hyphomicrobiales bacterium]MBO6913046.1 ABC transporter ATP-binding protein [Hyphomicrobiales bacterium]MBO6956635.1 ABC transporter ATP-binding protein [Hyphomicrobiales bacterium]
MAVVTLENICKSYVAGEERAVDDVSLTIQDGEFMVLLGPSGCGKSTTLRMIAGLESITSGTLSIDDEPMNAVPAKNRDIAMVFQSYALYPHMTVRDNLGFGLKRRKIPKAEVARRVEAVAESIGLSDYLERKPHALSGGQRQRVALGRAIVRDPKVFLFDEPLSNLDAALRVSTRAELVRLHRELSATMIYVTHDQVEAMTMGDRVCIMSKGEVAQVGTPMDVYLNPASTFVASFLGNPPMNLLPCVADEAGVTVAGRHWTGDTYGSAAGTDLVFGIRPEDLVHLESENGADFSGEILSVEPLGAETLIYVQTQAHDQPLIVREGRATTAKLCETIHLACKPGMVRLFDAQTGLALTPPTGETP